MGVEYGVFHRPTKEFIHIGKVRRIGEGIAPLGSTYQMPRERIEAFLAMHPGEVEIFGDYSDTPEDLEDGWVRVDDWFSTGPEPHVWDDEACGYRSLVTGEIEADCPYPRPAVQGAPE